METLARELRGRARALGLSDAEVARRAGLGERRYGHYVSGTREPNLSTLLKICDVLDATPNDLLGRGGKARAASGRERLEKRLGAAATILDNGALAVAVKQIEALLDLSERS